MTEHAKIGDALLAHPVVGQMASLLDIEAKIQEGVSPIAHRMYEEAAGNVGRAIGEQVASDNVFQAQLESAGDLTQVSDELTWLADQLDESDPDHAAQAREQIGRVWLLAEVAERFMGAAVSVEPVETATGTGSPVEQSDPEDSAVHEFFFGRPLDEVADDLRGRKIRVGNGEAMTIDKVLSQDGAYNAEFLDDPMFGDSRVGAYVGTSQGHRLLYLAAGASDECIRIVGVTGPDGTKAKSASKTTKALGLDKGGQVADVTLVGTGEEATIRLVRVRDRDRQ